MQRNIVQPPVPGELALTELKHWLGITRADDDAALAGLLASSVALCEAFTGQTPLRQVVEEVISPAAGWYKLVSCPVRELVGAALIAVDGTRTALAEPDYVFELRAAGDACVRLPQTLDGRGVALQLSVGIAGDWSAIPAPLKQGIIRLAAHHHLDRDGKPAAAPPASVTALWRPWRRMRLA